VADAVAWLRTLAIWVAFVAAMLGGATLVMWRSPTGLWLGLALLALPAVALTALAVAHYVGARRGAKEQ
jgi:hypothetical protein